MSFFSSREPRPGPGGEIVAPGDMYGQAKYCIEMMRNPIEEFGGTVEDVVRTRVFVTDISLWEEVGRAHGEVFGEIQLASAFIGVGEFLHPDLMIEIEAAAIVS